MILVEKFATDLWKTVLCLYDNEDIYKKPWHFESNRSTCPYSLIWQPKGALDKQKNSSQL